MYREILFLLLILILNKNCYGNICGEYECVNGVCENNVCNCQQCYTGLTCELMKNEPPHFEKSTYEVVLNKNSFDGKTILNVTANDDDKCFTGVCGCGEIIYSILEESAKDKFEINSNTGEISVKQDVIEPQIKFSFTVKATNKSPFDNIYDTTTVFINADTSNEILERHRRAVAPTKPNFVLSQLFPTQNLTTINIGQRLTVQLSVAFPVGTTTLSVELFAPETSADPVMMICDVTVVSKGSALTTNTFTPPLQEGLNGTVWPYTHIVFNFTNVVHNQASPTNLADIQVVISFDVVMLYSPTTANGTTYYVSGGSEYLNGTEIWVGQLGYIANMVTPTPSPTIKILGDTQIYPGRTASFKLNIQAPDSYLYLNMGVYTPLNNSVALSLCVVRRYYVGIAYSCLPTNYRQPTLASVTINNQIYYTSATMNLGVLGNRYYMEPSHTDINEKTINISVTARINPNLWVGNNYYVGFSISNTLSTIFASTYQVYATNPPVLISYTSQIQYSAGYHLGVQSMNIGQPGRIALNITIPEGTELDYTINARSSSNTSEICGVMIFKAGLNIPCVDQINFNSQYVFTADNYAVQAYTTINAIRHVKISNDTDDDVLTLLIIYRPINDSRNTQGGVTNIIVSLNWTGAAGTDKTVAITLDPVASSNANTTLPTFTFQMKGNDGNVSVGGSYQLYFSMRLNPGSIYAPTSLEFYMPFNGTVRVGICQISIIFVGKNVLCFNPALLTKKFVFSSKINDTSNYDKLLIPTGVLCTSTDPLIAPSINDEIQIIINVIILSHSMNTVGSTANLNGGMMITSTQIWVGNQPLTFVNKPAATTLTGSNSPLIYGQRIDALNNMVWINDLAIIQYIIKVAPAVTTSSMLLSISSTGLTSNNFGVCKISIINRGSSIPCVNGTLATTPWVAFSKFYQTGTFAFTDILNTGTVSLSASPTFDENSILVEAIVKFGPTIPATFTVAASLTSPYFVTATNTLTFSYQSALSRFNGTPSATEPVFNMALSPLFNNSLPVINNIAYSEAIRSVVNVQIQPGVLQSLKIVFASAPGLINQMDVLSVNILSVGQNIPCLQAGMIPFIVQKRPSSLTSDLTSIDMGTICHRQVSGNTTIEDNKIYIEAVFRVWKFPTGLPTTLQINVLGLVNNDQVYVTRIVFNTSSISAVTDTNLLGQTPNATAVLSPTTVAIGGMFTVNVTVTIPPYTQYKIGTIQVSSPVLPGSDSFCFIGSNINFTGVFGKNIGINKNEPLPMTLKSSMNTSQMDIIIADFGVVQNTATNYRMGQANYTSPSIDDTLSVLITAQLTDNSGTTNAQVINFFVLTTFGSSVQNISLQMTVSRTNTESMDFNTTTSLLSNKTIYTSDTTLMVSTQAIMLNTSTLECRNFTIHIAVPPFIQLSSIVNSSYSSLGYPIVQTNFSQGGFSFSVPYFFYKENISVIFVMSLIAGLNLTKSRSQSSLTIPVIYACQTLNWPSNPMGNKYFNKVDPLLFTVKGSDVNITGLSCNDDLKLTDSTVIKDCAITAYMSPYPGFEAIKIRSNSNSYWVPHMRSGQYNKLRYIDIKFGKLTTVSRIVVTSPIDNKPQVLTVYGTMDGRAFTEYQNLSLSYGSGNKAPVTLSNPPFTFRGIRVSILNALQNDQITGMNLDLYGCLPPNVTDSYQFDPCTTKSYSIPASQLPDFYYRGYLYVSPTIFVCDEIVSRSNSLETFPRCFRASQTQSFNTWEDLGNQVGKVIGFDSANSIIYAIASDVKSYIMSEDNGVTWVGINGGGWQVLKNLGGLKSPTVLPWTNDTTFDYLTKGTNCTKYIGDTPLNFCYDGIYSGATRLYSWNSCCDIL